MSERADDIAALRAKVQAARANKRDKAKPADPAPRYDEVYFEGVAALFGPSPLAFEMGGDDGSDPDERAPWPSAALSRQIELHDDAPPGPGAWAPTVPT